MRVRPNYSCHTMHSEWGRYQPQQANIDFWGGRRQKLEVCLYCLFFFLTYNSRAIDTVHKQIQSLSVVLKFYGDSN